MQQPFSGEKRLLIPSKKVATYDLVPEMSLPEITDHVLMSIKEKAYDVIICNFASPDMLGHTGNQLATEAGIAILDTCMGKMMTLLKKQGGEAMITADHGNAECMYDPRTQQPHTAHTMSPVPFLYLGRSASLAHGGTLADVASTCLTLLGLAIPKEMTGKNLVNFI